MKGDSATKYITSNISFRKVCAFSNSRVNKKILGVVESKRLLGKHPVLRGIVVNLVGHPHG